MKVFQIGFELATHFGSEAEHLFQKNQFPGNYLNRGLIGVYLGGGGAGLESGFKLSRSYYHGLQVGIGGVCRCRVWVWMWPHFLVPSHWLNFVTGEQKGITQTIILTPSRPISCLTY